MVLRLATFISMVLKRRGGTYVEECGQGADLGVAAGEGFEYWC